MDSVALNVLPLLLPGGTGGGQSYECMNDGVRVHACMCVGSRLRVSSLG